MIRLPVIANYIGRILVIVGIAMLSSTFWALYFEEEMLSLLIPALLTIAAGLVLSINYRLYININYREGFAIVTLGWVAACIFGTLPYFFSGLFTPADALFETVSGFTTTGATILTDIEVIPKGLLYWRSLTQWLGGMGIMALFVAIIAGIGVRANQIFKAEIPGPVSTKISPRIKETAKLLWYTYVVLSVILFILLYAFGMTAFDAFIHTFSTMATGGFSSKNASVGYFSPIIQWTIIVFMFLAGINFALHYLAFKNKSLKGYLANRELRLFALVVVIATVIVVFGLSQIGAGEERLRTGLFQVLSIVTTTGFATSDYNTWAHLDQGVILFLMFLGACAGSTSGNIKMGRYLIALERGVVELKRMIHPKAMIPQQYGDKLLEESLVINVLQFFFLYMLFMLLGALLLALMGLDLLTSLTASLSCISNIGPGFGRIGPTENYAFIPDAGKYLLSFLMLLGRLEIYPVLLMLLPDYWRK